MNIAIITAGGTGSRMKNRIPKQFVEVNGKPIILYTLDVFDSHPMIDAIVIVCLESWIDKLNDIVRRNDLEKVVRIVKGGEEGQQSIYNGLCAAREWVASLPQDEQVAEDECVVLVHDSVRPMIDADLITNNIEDTRKYGTSITVVPPTETFVIEESNSKHRFFRREDVHIVRAPQCFRLSDILQLHERAIADGKKSYKDCCSMMCDYDVPFHETLCDNLNIKITFPSDIIMFHSLIRYIELQQIIGGGVKKTDIPKQ